MRLVLRFFGFLFSVGAMVFVIAAAAAAFLALLWPRLRGRQPLAVAAGAAVVAALLTPWLMPGIPVIAAAGVAVAVGLFDPRAAKASTGEERMP